MQFIPLFPISPEFPYAACDLAESGRTKVLEKFRQLTAECNQTFDHLSEGIEEGHEENKCHALVLTDICLPLVNFGELPLTARVLINWELPAKKETYMRRISTYLATGLVYRY